MGQWPGLPGSLLLNCRSRHLHHPTGRPRMGAAASEAFPRKSLERLENELRGWYTDESLWPQDRTLDLFRSWFRIEPTSLVHDVATGPYVVEDA